MSNATESDSLSHRNPFQQKLITLNSFLLEDCDACGCSASGGSMGFASMLTTNFIGIRYFNQSYKSTDGLYSNSPWNDENYNTAQIWARIPIHKKVQISALIPYQFHNRESGNGKENISGLGDITILAMYQLFQTKKDSTLFNHLFQAGEELRRLQENLMKLIMAVLIQVIKLEPEAGIIY